MRGRSNAPTLPSSPLGRDWVIYHLTGGGHDLTNFASHVYPSGELCRGYQISKRKFGSHNKDVVNFEVAGL